MRFRKKPVVIEAFQMTPARRIDNSDWPEWMHCAWQEEREAPGSLYPTEEGTGDGTLSIGTLEGQHLVSWGDWIIQGVKGELYPCKPDIFALTYERTNAAPEPRSSTDAGVEDGFGLFAVALWLNGPLQISRAAIVRAPRLSVQRYEVDGVVHVRAVEVSPEVDRSSDAQKPPTLHDSEPRASEESR